MMEAATHPEQDIPQSVKDLFTENPRWCVGCGDFGILMGIKRFMVEEKIPANQTVNISGIGCSGRAPNYLNTYGVHSIHGRPITVALGLALTRPDLNLFIHSGDGDALSIGGNHLLHGVNKNFNATLIMYDNELYALTKSQTSPTTRYGHRTNTQPQGTVLQPLSVVRLLLGVGASFIATTADWMPLHLVATLKRAYHHKGFSFVHVSQRCPHFDPQNFNHKQTDWFAFLSHENGIEPDKRLADKAEIVEHDPANLSQAFERACQTKRYFGLYYHDPSKPCYDEILRQKIQPDQQKDRRTILDSYVIGD